MSQRTKRLWLGSLYGAGTGVAAQGLRGAFSAGNLWLTLLCGVLCGVTTVLVWRNVHKLRSIPVQGGRR